MTSRLTPAVGMRPIDIAPQRPAPPSGQREQHLAAFDYSKTFVYSVRSIVLLGACGGIALDHSAMTSAHWIDGSDESATRHRIRTIVHPILDGRPDSGSGSAACRIPSLCNRTTCTICSSPFVRLYVQFLRAPIDWPAVRILSDAADASLPIALEQDAKPTARHCFRMNVCVTHDDDRSTVCVCVCVCVSSSSWSVVQNGGGVSFFGPTEMWLPIYYCASSLLHRSPMRIRLWFRIRSAPRQDAGIVEAWRHSVRPCSGCTRRVDVNPYRSPCLRKPHYISTVYVTTDVSPSPSEPNRTAAQYAYLLQRYVWNTTASSAICLHSDRAVQSLAERQKSEITMVLIQSRGSPIELRW